MLKNYLSAETTTSTTTSTPTSTTSATTTSITTTPTTASSPGKFITIIHLINFMEINLLYFCLSLSDKRASLKQTSRAVVTGPAGPAAAGTMFGRVHYSYNLSTFPHD